MCDFITPTVLAVTSVVTSVVSGIVSATTAASNAQKQADAQAAANEEAAEQSAAQATAENMAANLKARQQAAIETRENLALDVQHSEASASNKVEFAEAGVEGNFILDISDALGHDVAQQKGDLSAQSLFDSQAAAMAGGDTTQKHLNNLTNLPSGSIDYSSEIVGAAGQIAGGLVSGIGSFKNPFGNKSGDFAPASNAVSNSWGKLTIPN
jgi:hypothetical protein